MSSMTLFPFHISSGGELFAKRKKRSDNWVVDESKLGSSDPKLAAEKFVAEQQLQQQQIIAEKEQELAQKFAVAERAKEEAERQQRDFQVQNKP